MKVRRPLVTGRAVAISSKVFAAMKRFSDVSAGCALGGLVDSPTAIASYTMTSSFIFLLWIQLDKSGNAVASASSAVVVVSCKLANITNVAVPLAAVVGAAMAMLACVRLGQDGGV